MNIASMYQDKVRYARKAANFLNVSIKGTNATAPVAADEDAQTNIHISAHVQQDIYTQQEENKSPEDNCEKCAIRSPGKFFSLSAAGPMLRRTTSFLRSSKKVSAIGVNRLGTGALYFSLPTELQLEIVGYMSLLDLKNLQQTSKAFHRLIRSNENHIVRQYVKNWVPRYISILYPVPPTGILSLQFLLGLESRQQTSIQLANCLAEQIVKEMGRSRPLRRNPLRPEDAAFIIERLRQSMAPLLLACYQFLETYRLRKAEYNAKTEKPDKVDNTTADSHIQNEILLQYPDCLLLQIHQMYHLLLHLFFRRLTPPSIWSRTPLGRFHTPLGSNRPSDESMSKVLLLGGIREVCRLYRMKGHVKRRKAMEKYVKKLDSERKAESGSHPTRMGSTINIPIDQLDDIFVPTASKQLIGRGIVTNMESVRCCGEFVADLLEDHNFSQDTIDSEDDFDDFDDEGNEHFVPIAPSAQMHSGIGALGRMRIIRMADDGNWDDDLIEEHEEEGDEGGDDGGEDDAVGGDGQEDSTLGKHPLPVSPNNGLGVHQPSGKLVGEAKGRYFEIVG